MLIWYTIWEEMCFLISFWFAGESRKQHPERNFKCSKDQNFQCKAKQQCQRGSKFYFF
jgi:hypothetical protein